MPYPSRPLTSYLNGLRATHKVSVRVQIPQASQHNISLRPLRRPPNTTPRCPVSICAAIVNNNQSANLLHRLVRFTLFFMFWFLVAEPGSWTPLYAASYHSFFHLTISQFHRFLVALSLYFRFDFSAPFICAPYILPLLYQDMTLMLPRISSPR